MRNVYIFILRLVICGAVDIMNAVYCSHLFSTINSNSYYIYSFLSLLSVSFISIKYSHICIRLWFDELI